MTENFTARATIEMPVRARDEEQAQSKARSFLYSKIEDDAANKDLSLVEDSIEVTKEE